MMAATLKDRTGLSSEEQWKSPVRSSSSQAFADALDRRLALGVSGVSRWDMGTTTGDWHSEELPELSIIALSVADYEQPLIIIT